MGFGVIIFIVHNSIHNLMNFLSLICRIAAAYANRNLAWFMGVHEQFHIQINMAYSDWS